MKALTCVALSAVLLLSGCGLVGAAMHKLQPPETKPALFKLGPEPTVVVVENAKNPGDNELDAVQVAALLRADLRKWQSANLIDDDAILRLRDKDLSAFRKMPLNEVGRLVGAKQVVYVDLNRVTIETDIGGQMVRGQFEAMVKVVDVQTGINRWPTNVVQGYPVGFETPFSEVKQRTTESEVRRGMHEQAVLQIGRFFRDWQPEIDHLK